VCANLSVILPQGSNFSLECRKDSKQQSCSRTSSLTELFNAPLHQISGRRSGRTAKRQAGKMQFVQTNPASFVLMQETDESELVARSKNGELEAFSCLVERYRNRIVNLAWQLLGNRDDAEDAAQETFLLAFERLSDFRGESQFSTWLYRIAINICKMKMRQRKPVEPLPEDYEPIEEFDRREVESRILLKRQIDEVLARLPEPLRLVLILREMHELSYEEIAQTLSIPVGTVRSRLFEARKKFAQIWRELFG
jgi:RNA polymerase sigma-70 factor (ECF subfamily)